MRGISSMFGSKRSSSDKSQPAPGPSSYSSQSVKAPTSSKKPSRLFGTISRKTSVDAHAVVHPALPRDQAQSSSSSSGSNSIIRTPGDGEGLTRAGSKASWMSWLSNKKTNADKKPGVHGEQWELSRDEWQRRPLPALRSPPSRTNTADVSEDESTSSESEDESEAASASLSTPLTPMTLAKSRIHLRALIENSLQPPFSPPPLIHIPGRPMFPRSCNSCHTLYTQETLGSAMHKARILQSLDAGQLSPADELSLRSFGTHAPIVKRPSLQLDEQAIPVTFQVRTYSQGLQKWALRPCFEDRVAIWVPDEGTGTISRTRVTGSSFGVAALEISEALDILAGAIVDEADLEIPTSHSSSSVNLPASHQGRNAPSLPSPLRMEHNTPLLTSVLVSNNSSSKDTRTMPAVPTVKRGVRFAEDDKEDQIPLGYILRIKKKREDKAKFLQEEKDRRAFEEDRVRQEEERLRREAERLEWEKEKKAWEAEKRAMEEERRKRQYAEEVVAARLRRDAARSGFYVPPPSTETPRPPHRESKSSRSAKDLPNIVPRRMASEPGTIAVGYGSPLTDSPTSSNPPSANGGSPNASGFFTRPPSINSANTTLSSSEDIQQQNRKSASKRNSVGADQAQRQASERASMGYYPAWTGGYMVPAVPVMPMMYHNLDMPLLPPTPPFMMQQTRRSQSPSSPNSPSGSRSSSRVKPGRSQNGSTDKLPSSHRNSTSSLRPESHHRRQSSDDALRAVQRPTVPDRRSGSAVDIHDRRSSPYATVSSGKRNQPQTQSPSTPQRSSYNQFGSSASLPRDYRGRPSASRRQTVIT